LQNFAKVAKKVENLQKLQFFAKYLQIFAKIANI
jgi:hypothetical protein